MFDVRESNWLLGVMISGDIGPLTFYTSQRNKHIVFDKKPPLNPPSQLQLRNRNLFKHIARSWHNLPELEQKKWEAATKRLGCRMNGYHLWVWWSWRHDLPALRTIERKTGITLIV